MNSTNKPPRDLKLEECANAWSAVSDTAEVKIEALKPVVAAYHRNLARVHALALFPAILAQFATVTTGIAAIVRAQNLPLLKAGSITEEEIRLKAVERAERLHEERQQRLSADPIAAQATIENELKIAYSMLRTILGSDDLKHGADAWMSSQIAAVWTAFESMSEAVWCVALNTHPEGLAELKATRPRPSGEEKKIELSLLQRNHYDLSNKMGDILSLRYSFDRLEGIRRAFGEAFWIDNQKIKTALDDRALDAIAETRHVIVHNGGIIDEKFLRRKNDLPSAILGDIGTTISLDGVIVRDLIVPVITRGWELIEAVDEWLATHPA